MSSRLKAGKNREDTFAKKDKGCLLIIGASTKVKGKVFKTILIRPRAFRGKTF